MNDEGNEGRNNMSYDYVIEKSFKGIITDYSNQIFKPITESDIHGYLYHLCLNECEKLNLPKNIHINQRHRFLEARKKVDLNVNDEIIVEVKFEADYPGVSKPVVLDTEVRKDIERVKNINASGGKAYFLFIDEDGQHYRNSMKRYNINQAEWSIVDDEKNRYILLICK